MEEKKKCVVLSRVSTLGQHTDDQTDSVVHYAESKGYEVVKIIEAKESAVKLKANERQSLIDLQEAHKNYPNLSAVFAWSISRIARREDALQETKFWLIENKINCYFQHDNVVLLNEDGTENSQASLYWSIFGHFASEEAKEIKAKTSRAKRYLTKNGKYCGGRILFGYQVQKDTNLLVINEQEAQVVYSIFSLYAQGKPLSEIIEYIDKMYSKKYNRIKIYQMLRNVSYKGGTDTKPYPAIIPESLFEKCRKTAKSNNTNVRKTKVVYLCHQLIKCSCGANFVPVQSNCSYVCSRHQHKKTSTIKCTADKHSLNMNIAETIAWISAKYFLQAFQVNQRQEALKEYNAVIEENTNLLNNIPNRENKLEEAKSRLAQLFLDDLIDEKQYAVQKGKIKAQDKEIEQDKTNYQSKIKEAQQALKRLESMAQMAYAQRKQVGDKIQEKQYDEQEMYNIIHQFVKCMSVEKIDNVELVTVYSYSNTKYQYAYYPMQAKLYLLLIANKMNSKEQVGRYKEIPQEEWLHRFLSPVELLNRKK